MKNHVFEDGLVGLSAEVWAIICLLIDKGIITDEDFVRAYKESFDDHMREASNHND